MQGILNLEFEMTELKNTCSKFINKIKRSLELLKNLTKLYQESDCEGKQMILGLAFSRKLFLRKINVELSNLML